MATEATCVLCGQPLGDPSVLARYEHNVQEHDQKLVQLGETQARRNLEAEYAAKEQIRVATLTQQAEERAEKKYEGRSDALAKATRAQEERLKAATREAEARAEKKYEARTLALAKATRAQDERLQAATREAERKAEKKYLERNLALERTAHQQEEQNEMLKRKLERLSSADRGAFNEHQLVSDLTAAFNDDKIELHKSGAAGTDIRHEVRYRSGGVLTSAGLIVYECKDTLHWNNAFIVQTKASLELHHANHAILVTRALPSNQKGFLLQDNVAIVEPRCMVSIAQVLREGLIAAARAGLSAEGKAAKTQELYRYLSGDEFRLTFEALVAAGTKLQEALHKEQRDHNKTWAQRDAFYKKIDQGMTVIQESIASIIERPVLREVVADRAGALLEDTHLVVNVATRPPVH